MNTLIKMQFDPQIAKDVGVEEAIMYSNIEYWCEKNKANEKNFHDNNYWTYNSKKAFIKLFPFWSERQIERIISNLKKKKYIETGNYNKVKYDKTLWYATLPRTRDIDSTKRWYGSHQTVEPIPNSKPDSKHSLQIEDLRSDSNKKKLIKKQENDLLKSLSNSKQEDDCEPKFDCDEYIEKMIKDKKRHISLIGVHFKITKASFPTKYALQVEMKRNLKDAKLIAEYPEEAVDITFSYVSKNFPDMWKMSTIAKYISNYKNLK